MALLLVQVSTLPTQAPLSSVANSGPRLTQTLLSAHTKPALYVGLPTLYANSAIRLRAPYAKPETNAQNGTSGPDFSGAGVQHGAHGSARRHTVRGLRLWRRCCRL
eukprot:162017-Rhodomonas_salina.2